MFSHDQNTAKGDGINEEREKYPVPVEANEYTFEARILELEK
jgi:hypothetical protein